MFLGARMWGADVAWGELAEVPRLGLAWAFAFAVARGLFPARSLSFSNRVVSVVHAFVSAALCAPFLGNAVDIAHPFDSPCGPNTEAQRRAMAVSTAYFVYDFLCCAYVAVREDPKMLDLEGALHHLATLSGLVYGLVGGQCGATLTLCLLTMEVSNPFMHGRFLMKELGIKDTPLNVANDVLFAAIFFLCRILLGPVQVHAMLVDDRTPLPVKAGGVGIQLISFYWFYLIVKMARKTLAGPKKSAKRG